MIPLWLAIGLVVCFSLASFNTFQKKLVSSHSPLVVGFYSNVIGVVFVSIVALVNGIDLFSIAVVPFLGLSVAFNSIAFYALPKALQSEDLGVIAPVRGLIPISIAGIEPLVFPSLTWTFELVGAAFLAGLGLYIAFSQDGLLTPIKKVRTVGIGYAFLSAVAIVGAVLTDRYVVHTLDVSFLTYGIFLIGGTALVLGIGAMLKQDSLPRPDRFFIGAGISRGLAVGLGLLTLTLVSGTEYNIVVQLSIPLSVVFGYVFLNETEFTGRQLAGSFLIIGSIIVIL